ncbi:MAG: ATP-binding cassette domain-containing protein [Rhodobacteraceae bacterium]|nr:ATP-binding cassette domain-containing protein [Paracoccaceae bacterium]
MLSLTDVDVKIQATPILRHLSLKVETGEVVSLIGRNGAGKTTTLRTIMGMTRPEHGAIHFGGNDISAMKGHHRPALGIGYMPEDRRLVPQLTVEENILLPAWVNNEIDQAQGLELVYELMPELEAMKERKALLLSGGQQKMAALGRALVAGSKLLLLDEPFEGVAPALSQRLSEVIGSLRGEAQSILIAQSELSHSGTLSDRDIVIERGAIV